MNLGSPRQMMGKAIQMIMRGRPLLTLTKSCTLVAEKVTETEVVMASALEKGHSQDTGIN